MPIDINSETLVRFADAKSLPGRPNSTNLAHWAKNGIRAENGKLVFLDTVKIGRSRFTSREAFTRFSQQLTTQTDEK